MIVQVVNWFRAVGDEGEVIGEDETYTVVDVVNTEKSSCCNAITEVSSDVSIIYIL